MCECVYVCVCVCRCTCACVTAVLFSFFLRLTLFIVNRFLLLGVKPRQNVPVIIMMMRIITITTRRRRRLGDSPNGRASRDATSFLLSSHTNPDPNPNPNPTPNPGGHHSSPNSSHTNPDRCRKRRLCDNSTTATVNNSQRASL